MGARRDAEFGLERRWYRLGPGTHLAELHLVACPNCHQPEPGTGGRRVGAMSSLYRARPPVVGVRPVRSRVDPRG